MELAGMLVAVMSSVEGLWRNFQNGKGEFSKLCFMAYDHSFNF